MKKPLKNSVDMITSATQFVPPPTRNARGTFMEELEKLVLKDPKIILIVGDVGFSYMEEFQKKYPKNYFNFGVTEQSMTVAAAGLALAGFKPYVYSMVNFVTFRQYEQVRNGVCYHNANVKLVGVRGSVHYKFLGYSHNIYGDEDVKVLTGLPNMKIHIPKEPSEIPAIMQEMYEYNGPSYIRL